VSISSVLAKGWEKAKALELAKPATLYKSDNTPVPCYCVLWSEQLERTKMNPIGNPPLEDGTRVQRDTFSAVVDVLPEKDWLLKAKYMGKDCVFEQLKESAEANTLYLLELGLRHSYG
jgi:hypothetical protein